MDNAENNKQKRKGVHSGSIRRALHPRPFVHRTIHPLAPASAVVKVVQETAGVLVTFAVVDLAALPRALPVTPRAGVERAVFLCELAAAVVSGQSVTKIGRGKGAERTGRARMRRCSTCHKVSQKFSNKPREKEVVLPVGLLLPPLPVLHVLRVLSNVP